MENSVINGYQQISGVVLHQWSSLATVNSLPERSLMNSTKKAYSEVFSTSKRTGKNLWELLAPILPDPNNKEVHQLLDVAIYQWLLTNPLHDTSAFENVPFITGFQFNDEFTLKEKENITLKVTRNTDNSLELTTHQFNPAKDISAPLNTESLSFKIMAVSCNVNKGMKTGCYITELSIPYSDMQILSQNIQLPLYATEGNLIAIAMTIEYTITTNTASQKIHNKQCTPAGIVWAAYN